MYQQLFSQIKEDVLNKLKGLNENLFYHSAAHTLDVTKQAERIALRENITDPNDLFLLKVAALYHDTGFLFIYTNHEEKSCSIFKADAVQYGFSENDISKVCNIIMATKIPQTPVTKLEEIICDADLDYLGREDFMAVSEKLRNEFLKYGIVKNMEAWEKLQLAFLTNHKFFTATSIKERNALKQKHLERIIASAVG